MTDFTLREVSERTRIPLATLRRWRMEGRGPAMYRLGGRVMVREDDLEAWLRDRYETTRTGGVEHQGAQ